MGWGGFLGILFIVYVVVALFMGDGSDSTSGSSGVVVVDSVVAISANGNPGSASATGSSGERSSGNVSVSPAAKRPDYSEPHDADRRFGFETATKLQCQEFIRRRLRHPSSATFELMNGTASRGSDKLFRARSAVTAPNESGRMIRSAYRCTAQYVGGDSLDPDSWELVKLTMDDESILQ